MEKRALRGGAKGMERLRWDIAVHRKGESALRAPNRAP